MKKTLYITAFAFMLAGSALTSCSDFLEADNKSTANKNADDDLINRPEQLLYEAYASVYNFAFNVTMTDEGTDLYIPVRGKVPSELDNYTLTASNDEVYSYYKELYTTINDANAVHYYVNKKIEETDTVKPAQKAYKAEASFLRCWCYYLLTQQFGAVPYVTDYYNTYTQSFPRVDADSIYNSCISELKGVYNDGTLPTMSNHSSNYAQPTQEACAALISKFYLAQAWDKYVEQEGKDVDPSKISAEGKDAFKNAAEWAEKSIGITSSDNPPVLSMTFADKWDPEKDNNSEVLWSIQSNRNATLGAHSLQNDYGNYYGDQASTGYKQVGSKHAQSNKSLRLFARGDLRYEATFMTTIPYKKYFAAYDGSVAKVGYRYFPYYTTVDEAKDSLAKAPANYVDAEKVYILDNTCTEFKFNAETGDVASTSTATYESLYSNTVGSGVCVKKYDDPTSTKNSSDDYRCVPVFHISDMYLTAAEAYYMAGDADRALLFLNKVRERAYGNVADAATGGMAGDLKDFTAATYQSVYSYAAPEGGFIGIDVILDERAREMYAERTRWVDLRRTNQLVRYNNAYNPNLTSSVKTLRPIPTNEMSSNTGITQQNDGY